MAMPDLEVNELKDDIVDRLCDVAERWLVGFEWIVGEEEDEAGGRGFERMINQCDSESSAREDDMSNNVNAFKNDVANNVSGAAYGSIQSEIEISDTLNNNDNDQDA